MKKGIEIKKGSVLNTNFKIIAHQVNTAGVMGTGVALAIREKCPDVFEEYHNYCQGTDEKDMLGTCLLIKSEEYDQVIANLFGQTGYGFNGDDRQTKYDLLYNALIDLRDTMWAQHMYTVSFPYLIGCGVAKGDPKIVLSLIREVFDSSGIIYNFYNIN